MRKGLSTVQRRVYWLIGIGMTCAVILIVSIAVPITVFQARDQYRREKRWYEEINEADRWASTFRSTVIDAIALTHGIEGFTLASMTSLPPFNGPVEDRIRGQMFGRFQSVASKMYSTTTFRPAFILAPGGVVLQTFPEYEDLFKYDFLDPKNELGEPTAIESIDTASVVVFGPLNQPLPFPGKWHIVVRDPIYNVTDIANASRKNFWGFSLVVQDVDAMMDGLMLDESTQRKGLDYLSYTVGRTTDEIVPIRFSLKPNPTLEEMREFIDTGTSRTVLRNRLSWYICLRSRYQKPELTRTTVVIVIVSAVFGSLLIFLIGASIVLVCLRDYDGWNHAPKTTPFAMAVIGPCSGEQLWELAPERMLNVSERLAAVQGREIVRHHAYEGVQLHPYTTTVITRTVESALQLCFGILEELQSQPIDDPLRELLGDDGRLLVACAVHWCTDATVRMETLSRSIRYEGPDVVYGGRMWVFAAPNEVSISEAARRVANNLPGVLIRPLASVFLRGVAERQDLYTITIPNNKRLMAASLLAKRDTSINDVPIISSPGVEKATENPLSMCSGGLLQSNRFSSGEVQGSGADSSGVLSSESSSWVTESSGVGLNHGGSNSNGSGCGGNMKNHHHHNRTSDTANGTRGLKQINVPKTLIELVPTDEMSPIHQHRDVNARPTPPLSSADSNSKSFGHDGGAKPRITRELKSGGRLLENDQLCLVQMQKSSNLSNNSNSTNNNSNKKPHSNNAHGLLNRSVSDLRESLVLHDGDFLTEALLHPKIPTSVDTHLRAVFEQQALVLDLSYDSVRTIIYYFFSAFKVLLKPLAEAERSNIFRRFVMAFGIPLHDVVEHLAVRCALRHIQQLDDTRSLRWNCQQQAQLQLLVRLPRGSSPLVDCSGTTRTSESFFPSVSRSVDG
ncbi:hypothetical protein LSM04_001123 [Trypanosoma melophagium]|uniref:uncharacterized protein n=1 Tax=Trypanosoma melophagium TaxID=715481 RepID=UPI003519E610|nr:hypothetical protein LSM04_001123 [Trypanosoma melophagium]